MTNDIVQGDFVDSYTAKITVNKKDYKLKGNKHI